MSYDNKGHFIHPLQVSPPTEHAMYYEYERPWWERMQPVSYILVSSSGDEEDFADMVERCNRADVRYEENILPPAGL